MAYSLGFLSVPGELFTYTLPDIRSLLTLTAVVCVIIFLVGKLKSRFEKKLREVKTMNTNFPGLLSQMNVQVLVTDPETNQILFANENMNKSYGVSSDPTGLPCWQVYHGLSGQCGFCRFRQLHKNPGTPLEWEHWHSGTGRYFHNRDSLIPWTSPRSGSGTPRSPRQRTRPNARAGQRTTSCP